MKLFPVFFLMCCTINAVKNENTTEADPTQATTDEYFTTDSSFIENITKTTSNEIIEDKPSALPLIRQRIRRGPPVTIYKHRVRVSKRRQKPRRRTKGHRPVYGPPKPRLPLSPSFHKPKYPESHEASDSYSFSSSYDKPSHSSLDVSSDFDIQSIPSSEYGGSKESFEFNHGDSYDDDEIPFDPDSFSLFKPIEKHQKKHQRIKPISQTYGTPPYRSEETVGLSYDPPVRSIEYDSHTFHDESPSYSYIPKNKPSNKHHKPPTSYSQTTSSKSYESISIPSHSKSKGYSFETPPEQQGKSELSYTYEATEKPQHVHYDTPEQSYSPLPEYLDIHSSRYHPKPSIKTLNKHQKDTGYSYGPPAYNFAKQENTHSYPYTPTNLPYKPHETYGVPPAPKPPSSSYGYPELSHGHTTTIDDKHGISETPSKDYSIPNISYRPKLPNNSSPPGSLFDLPSPTNDGEIFNKHSTSDYISPDTTYSFTTKTNTYNALPTDRPKGLPGHFAEPPSDYKGDFSKNGLSTSHFPLDQDHLSSNYGSPKSSYEVPIYDAVPFTTPSQDYYPPNLPTSYNQNGFENIARGSHKFEVSASHNQHNPLTPNRENQQINDLPALDASHEVSLDFAEDYPDEIISTQTRRKRRGKPKNRRGGDHTRRPADLDGAFSSQDEVKVYTKDKAVKSTISTVLNNTSSFSNWTPMKPNNKGQLIRFTIERDPHVAVSIDKSHSQSYYDGTISPNMFHGKPNSDKKKQINADISEINLQSPDIFISDHKEPHYQVTRKGSVFDETLNYWGKHPLPPNHKLNR